MMQVVGQGPPPVGKFRGERGMHEPGHRHGVHVTRIPLQGERHELRGQTVPRGTGNPIGEPSPRILFGHTEQCLSELLLFRPAGQRPSDSPNSR